MKKKWILGLATISLAFATAGFVGCGESANGGNGDVAEMEIKQVYAQYVIHAEASGEEVLSYEAWLASIKGEKGKSAYQIWLENGHSGSEEDFLNWLKGEQERVVRSVDYQNGYLVITYTDGTVDYISLPTSNNGEEPL
ncbi:MAG: hypothetical protein E7368_01645, partial [Clostridiales bacterium]|nr:hypothetical protein [Clostridiales bacterium]